MLFIVSAETPDALLVPPAAKRVSAGRPRKPPAPIVSEINKPALNALKNKLTVKSYSKNTRRIYYYEFAQLLYLLGDYNVDDMDVKRLESILENLRNYYKEYQPKKYLFEGQNGGRYSIRSAQNIFKKAMEKAKINKDVGIHGLRHSFATHLLENGTDISYIQQLLGHSDVKTTMIYAKVAQKSLRKIKSPLDDLH